MHNWLSHILPNHFSLEFFLSNVEQSRMLYPYHRSCGQNPEVCHSRRLLLLPRIVTGQTDPRFCCSHCGFHLSPMVFYIHFPHFQHFTNHNVFLKSISLSYNLHRNPYIHVTIMTIWVQNISINAKVPFSSFAIISSPHSSPKRPLVCFLSL